MERIRILADFKKREKTHTVTLSGYMDKWVADRMQFDKAERNFNFITAEKRINYIEQLLVDH